MKCCALTSVKEVAREEENAATSTTRGSSERRVKCCALTSVKEVVQEEWIAAMFTKRDSCAKTT
jgi:hypothetical protein